jgi:hypothetical protein
MAKIQSVRGAYFKGMRGLRVDLQYWPPTFHRLILLQEIQTALGRCPIVSLSDQDKDITGERSGLPLAPGVISDDGLQAGRSGATFLSGGTQSGRAAM